MVPNIVSWGQLKPFPYFCPDFFETIRSGIGEWSAPHGEVAGLRCDCVDRSGGWSRRGSIARAEHLEGLMSQQPSRLRHGASDTISFFL
jgi:hypothetical protein